MNEGEKQQRKMNKAKAASLKISTELTNPKSNEEGTKE